MHAYVVFQSQHLSREHEVHWLRLYMDTWSVVVVVGGEGGDRVEHLSTRVSPSRSLIQGAFPNHSL